MVAGAPGLVTQALAEGLQALVDLVALALNPGGAALGVGAARPGLFHARQHGGVQQAIGQGFPGAHLHALAPAQRNKLAHRRQGVHVLDDHARVEHGFAAVHHQAGNFAQRVGFGNAGVGRPHVFQLELVVELLLGQHDPDLADEGAGEGSDQFHG